MGFRNTIAAVGVVVGCVLLAAMPVEASPNDGNGMKLVGSIEFGPVPGPTCDSGEILTVEGEGWVQVFVSPSADESGNLEHAVFHLDLTHSNAAGETWVWNDRGPDRIFLIDGVPFVAITGRAGGSGVIGQVVVNLLTGEVTKVAGTPVGDGGPFAVDAAACDALT